MFIRCLTAIVGMALASTSALAADFSFTGTFTQDNQKAAYAFTLAAPSTVTLTSLGYAGGTNAAGATIARGGFDPVLSLYDQNGDAIDFGDDGNGAPLDAVTGVGGDPILTELLGPGRYVVYLTQYSNFGPLVVPGEFAFDKEPNFRNGFIDLYGDQRTGNFALDIRGVDSAGAVPEPATWVSMLAGFGAIGGTLRYRRRLNAALAA